MSEAYEDPRTKIQHDIELGQVYTDSRNDQDLKLVYFDDEVALLRNRDGHHRLSTRDQFNELVGAGRFSLSPDAEPFDYVGRLERLQERKEEFAEQDGRLAKHFEEAFDEAISLLTEDTSDLTHVDYDEVEGVGEKTAKRLHANGYSTERDVNRASDDELLDVDGVGRASLEAIREHVE